MRSNVLGTKQFKLALTTLLAMAVTMGVMTSVNAAGETIATGGAQSVGVGMSTQVDGVVINGTDNSIVNVRLRVQHGTLAVTTTTGLTFTSPTSTPYSANTLEFSGLRSDVNAALASMTYIRSSSIGSDELEVTLARPGIVFNPVNGHVYEFVEVPGDISWEDARTAASSRSLQIGTNSYQGYLVTLTTDQENNYVAARLSNAGWMGATDTGSEGNWQWVDGPEAGQSFWLGDFTGSPVNGRYNKWNMDEPNDMGNEDCGQYLSGSGGAWNDLPCLSTALLPGYVVEYGEPNNLPNIGFATKSIQTFAPTLNISSCPQFEALDDNATNRFAAIELTADIDCNNRIVAPLDFSGEWFEGTFNGQGHEIRNLIINDLNGTVGLFRKSQGATFENFRLRNGSVTGNTSVGGVVGEADNTSFKNIHSNFDVTALSSDEVGGLVGESDVEGTIEITGNSVTGHVTGAGDDVGGLYGEIEFEGPANVLIKKNFTTGTVSGVGQVGGLFGDFYYDIDDGNATVVVEDNYTWGDVTATSGDFAGGLVGNLDTYANSGLTSTVLTFQRNYSAGTITGWDGAGGLVGYFEQGNRPVIQEFTFRNNFAAGAIEAVHAPGNVGMLFGYLDTDSDPITIVNNYYDAHRTGVAQCDNTGSITGCAAVNVGNATPNYFMNNKINSPLDTWNFNGIWRRNINQYPTFGTDGVDDDNDGIGSAVEAAGPNGGDANNDGIADNQQPHVTSLPNGVTGKYVSVEVDGTCDTRSASTLPEPVGARDSGYEYPAGLVSFSTDCSVSGFRSAIKLYFYGQEDKTFVARKYLPASSAYFTLPDATVGSLTLGGQRAVTMSYTVTDGSTLDLDGLANGVIVDPAGLGISVVGVPNTGLGRSLTR